MLTLPNLICNVIEAGNRNVPEASQLLRVVSVSDDKICVEHRPVLDLPFAKACVTLTNCQGGCQVVAAPATAVEPSEAVAEAVAEQPAEPQPETIVSVESAAEVEIVAVDESAPEKNKSARKDRQNRKS